MHEQRELKEIAVHDARYNRDFTIKIIYHDENLIIINKPHDIRVDGSTLLSPTIESSLMNEFPEYTKLYLLHQLDYVTSGIHCWGLNKLIASKWYSHHHHTISHRFILKSVLDYSKKD